jgi:hypothetical protein
VIGTLLLGAFLVPAVVVLRDVYVETDPRRGGNQMARILENLACTGAGLLSMVVPVRWLLILGGEELVASGGIELFYDVL